MQLKLRRWLWVLIGAIALVVAFTAVVVLGCGLREPLYQGIGLSAWLDGRMYSRGTPPKQISEALRTVGPEALPWLTRAFELNNGKGSLSKLHRRYVRFYITSPNARRFLPAPPIPRWEIARHNSLNILARLAPGTPYERRVLRDLISAYDTGEREFARARLHALGFFTNSPALVVPVLLTGITNPAIIDASIQALRPFGASASGPLCKMAATEGGFIRPAELALEKVDPEAYYRLLREKQRF